MHINLLAIESSCDETAAAVMVDAKIKSNIIATQAIHEQYGGVVPELASRAHQKNIIPVVDKAIKEADITTDKLSAIAFTRGPGLLGALIVGVAFSKALALALNIPIIGVNHMQAHILAHFIEDPKPQFPFLCLTASGGHTQIVLVKDYLNMEVVGQTHDDAVGEVFDKAAKMLGLPYPGGILIDKYAQEGKNDSFNFPNVRVQGLNFSFSGIKTAFLYFLQRKQKEDTHFIKENLPDICASMQHTLINLLMQKLNKAVKKYQIKEVAIAGGVSANSALRTAIQEKGNKDGWQVFIPAFEYCTDNAAMVAMAGHYKYLEGQFAEQNAAPLPRMKF